MWELYKTVLYILDSSHFSIVHIRRFFRWRTNTRKRILMSKEYAVAIKYMGLYILVILSVLRRILCHLLNFWPASFILFLLNPCNPLSSIPLLVWQKLRTPPLHWRLVKYNHPRKRNVKYSECWVKIHEINSCYRLREKRCRHTIQSTIFQ